tara:strand:+ start:216 stop:395 length:180 start_codon:yes stop_codon:yes gene_type:complete
MKDSKELNYRGNSYTPSKNSNNSEASDVIYRGNTYQSSDSKNLEKSNSNIVYRGVEYSI